MMIQVFFKNLSRKFQHSFTFFNTVNSLRTKKAECGSVRNRYIRQLSTGLSIVAEIDLAEICINIMDTMSQDKLTFCINDIQQLLMLSNIKVETYQIRNILKRNWRLTPTDNSLAYSTFIKNFPPGPPYREEKKTGRYYTITKEFLKKFR